MPEPVRPDIEFPIVLIFTEETQGNNYVIFLEWSREAPYTYLTLRILQ